MRQPILISRQTDSGPSVSSDYLRLLALGAEARGVDMIPIWAAARIDPAVLGVRGARVALPAVERVWDQVTTRLGDHLFGLELAASIPFGSANLIDYVVMSSVDIGAALRALARYSPLMSNSEQMTVVVSDESASIRFETSCTSTHPVEMVVALLARRARELFGPSWTLAHVCFAHPPQGPLASYERVLQVPTYFRRPVTEAVFSRELLSLPMAGADPTLNANLTAQAEELLAALTPPAAPSFESIIRRTLRDGLTKGDVTLTRLASQMGLSARTVQRRLRAEGLTHRQLVRGLRHDLATKSLAAPISQGQIARTLGYSGTGAFQRAFKRWSGVAPGELRERRGKARRRR